MQWTQSDERQNEQDTRRGASDKETICHGRRSVVRW